MQIITLYSGSVNIPLGQMVRPLRPDNTGRVIATFFIGGARGMEQRGSEEGRGRLLLSTLRAYIFYGSSTSKGEKASHQGQASAHAVAPPRVFKVRATTKKSSFRKKEPRLEIQEKSRMSLKFSASATSKKERR